MNILRIAAFTHNATGGNPAGVCLRDTMPSVDEMLKIAKQVGYSETAFCVRQADGWRVRYFAPTAEVPFCGHATIALGAGLGETHGAGSYQLILNDTQISISVTKSGAQWSVVLQSPETWSQPAPHEWVELVCQQFGLAEADFHPEIPPALIFGGARHMLISLQSRLRLSQLGYNFAAIRDFQNDNNLITVAFICPQTSTIMHTRNMFAFGGVYEDPATGAASAAICGYLRDIGWPHQNAITIYQGEDMGRHSKINATFCDLPNSSIAIGGETALILI